MIDKSQAPGATAPGLVLFRDGRAQGGGKHPAGEAPGRKGSGDGNTPQEKLRESMRVFVRYDKGVSAELARRP